MNVKELQPADNLSYNLLDIVHNAVLVTDALHNIIYINSWAKKMFNAPDNSLIGRHIETIFPQEDRDILVKNILNITKEKQELETEVMLQRLDGTYFPGSVTVSSFLWDRKNKGMSYTVHDLTYLKSIEKTLEKSERIAFLGTLINNISHQIRNPITVIGGFVRRLAETEPYTASTEAILKETARLEELLAGLDNLINLPKPRPRKVLLKKIQDTIENLFLEKVTPLGLEWRIIADRGLTEQPILIDLPLIIRALEAIVINSCEACRNTKQKTILLEIISREDAPLPLLFKVTDSGEGIAKNNLQFLFNLFYSNKTNHIGMGLTLAQRIIEEQGGSITIDSIAGQGTTVTVQLLKERRRPIRTTRFS